MYIVERFPFLSIWTYHIAYVPLKKKTLFINDAAPTTRSPINLALGISKILTLRLALRLFGKSSNNGSAVYIVLAIWDRMNCCTSTTWVRVEWGSRVEGQGRVRTSTSVSIWTTYGAKWVNLHSKICLYTSVFGVCTSSSYWNLLKDIYSKNMIISLTKVGTRSKRREY